MSELDKLRTILANERTVLAYVRTALAILVSGMAAVKFFPEHRLIVLSGWLAIATGTIVLIFGAVRFRKIHKTINGE
jgi:putative membrane protein